MWKVCICGKMMNACHHLVSHNIRFHCSNSSKDTSCEQVYKYRHPNVTSMAYFASQRLCNEILSWMIEVWIKHRLVSDIFYNIIVL